MMRGASPQHLATAHAAIVDEVTRDGKRWISETVVNGHSVIRMMVISYLTGENHLRTGKRADQRSPGISVSGNDFCFASTLQCTVSSAFYRSKLLFS